MKKILASLLAGLFFCSCVPVTPQGRLDKDPGKFAGLSKKDKELALQGKVERGMSQDAVVLAWGPPARRFEGSMDKKATERWDYESTRPVTTTFFGSWGGYGYGGYGYSRYSSVGIGVGPEIAYVPYRVGSVWFLGSKVDSWERMR